MRERILAGAPGGRATVGAIDRLFILVPFFSDSIPDGIIRRLASECVTRLADVDHILPQFALSCLPDVVGMIQPPGTELLERDTVSTFEKPHDLEHDLPSQVIVGYL